MEQAQEMV